MPQILKESSIKALQRAANANHGIVLQPIQVAEIFGTLVAMGQEIEGMQMYIQFAQDVVRRAVEKYGEIEGSELIINPGGLDTPIEGQQIIVEAEVGVDITPEEG